MTEHRIFRIQGRVQGVFFRQTAKQQAQQLGLSGYARNEADGSVTIEAEGDTAALDALETWCRQGPPAARVTQVTVAAGAGRGFAGFEVQR